MATQQEHQLTQFQYERVRRQAILRRLLATIRRRSRDLLVYDEVYRRIQVHGQRDGGLQSVPLAQIVGTLQRAEDFDRAFLPLRNQTAARWQRVYLAYASDQSLPPVELYKLGTLYFVADGHHRVSVARFAGQAAIEAHVIEVQTDVPLRPDLDTADLPATEELSDFLEWTGLARLRPAHGIEVRTLGGYLDLIASINRHWRSLCQRSNADVSRDAAIADWYDSVYLPAREAVQQSGLYAAFPRLSSAELAARVLAYQPHIAPGPPDASALAATARAYLQHCGSRWAPHWLRRRHACA